MAMTFKDPSDKSIGETLPGKLLTFHHYFPSCFAWAAFVGIFGHLVRPMAYRPYGPETGLAQDDEMRFWQNVLTVMQKASLGD